MTEKITTDVCIIGAGAGGLALAAGTSAFGVDTVIIEAGKMGGDCLNYGCVPSKALLAAAKFAKQATGGEKFGVTPKGADIDFTKVMGHVHDVIATIEPHDSEERFTELGCKVIRARGSFKDAKTVVAGDYEIKARRFVIATGSGPMVPPIEGLDKVPYMTNENVFELTELPSHLLVIGGGPIGMEMAQAFRRLGAEVDVIEAFKTFSKEDPEMRLEVLRGIEKDGVRIHEGWMVKKVGNEAGAVSVEIEKDGATEVISGSHLLVAAGRRVNVDGLNLEAAGIEYSPRGVKVDAYLRSTNRKVYAIGDIAGGFQFTHVAGYHSSKVLAQILFRVPAKPNNDIVPWCTYTDPEICWAGISVAAAKEKFGDKASEVRFDMKSIDRYLAEGKTDGFVKLVIVKGKIVGGGAVGDMAGELVNMIALAIEKGYSPSKLTGYIPVYPTRTEIVRRAAVMHLVPITKSSFVRGVVGFLRKFG